MDSPVFLAVIAVLWALVIYLLLDRGDETIQSVLIRVGISVLMIYGLYLVPSIIKLGPAVVLGLLWGPQVTKLVAGTFLNSMTGAGARSDDQAYYSMAEGKRARNDIDGAIAEINAQLRSFPGDFEGQMLLASIQAENQMNFDAAHITIENLLHQAQHKPSKIAYALTTLADWQLKYSRDEDGARVSLQRLMGLYPGTQIELRTAQRVARMDQTFEHNDQRDVGSLVSECLKHLEKHPLDNHTREILARIYFLRFNRSDLGIEELKKLINVRHQSTEDVSRWLNLTADWHISMGNKSDASECLAIIIERFPTRPVAELAEQRLTMMRGETP